MGKLFNGLQKQLKEKELKQYAEDCLKIYNILLEKEGAVWRSKWEVLTDWIGVKGKYPNSFLAYKPSELGYMFLKQNEK